MKPYLLMAMFSILLITKSYSVVWETDTTCSKKRWVKSEKYFDYPSHNDGVCNVTVRCKNDKLHYISIGVTCIDKSSYFYHGGPSIKGLIVNSVKYENKKIFFTQVKLKKGEFHSGKYVEGILSKNNEASIEKVLLENNDKNFFFNLNGELSFNKKIRCLKDSIIMYSACFEPKEYVQKF